MEDLAGATDAGSSMSPGHRCPPGVRSQASVLHIYSQLGSVNVFAGTRQLSGVQQGGGHSGTNILPVLLNQSAVADVEV